MSDNDITNLIKTNFNEHQVEQFAEAEQLAAQLYKGANLDRWLSFVPTLSNIRTAAMRGHNSKNPAYQKTLNIMVRRLLPSFYDADENKVRSQATHLLWLGEEVERMQVLADYRAGLTPAKHAALESPKAARNAVTLILKAREAEAAAKRLGARNNGDDVQQALAADKAEPEATDKQLLAAFRRKPVSQMSVLLIAENQDRAHDLAKSIINEIRQARIDAKDQAARRPAS